VSARRWADASVATKTALVFANAAVVVTVPMCTRLRPMSAFKGFFAS
jgi:hypothetical protein